MKARLRSLKAGAEFRIPELSPREGVVTRLGTRADMVGVKIRVVTEATGQVFMVPVYLDPDTEVEVIDREREAINGE